MAVSMEPAAPAYLLADRGYDSAPRWRPWLPAAPAPSFRRKRRSPRAYDPARYTQRHPVERRCRRLK